MMLISTPNMIWHYSKQMGEVLVVFLNPETKGKKSSKWRKLD